MAKWCLADLVTINKKDTMHSFIRILVLTLFSLAPIRRCKRRERTRGKSATLEPESTDVYHVFFG